MNITSIKILIEGIGGIGGIMAARLIEMRINCTLVTGNDKITASIKKHGIIVISEGFEKNISTNQVYTLLSEIPENSLFDIGLLIMKANSVVEAAKSTLPYLKENGYVVTMQNGVVEDAVSEEIGKQRVVSGIIGWGGTMHNPGKYEKTTPGDIHIGELNGSVTDRLRVLEKILSLSSTVIISENIRGALWSKLAINCTITTLGALSGQTLGEMLSSKDARKLFLQIYSEVVDTATSLDIKLEKIAANPYLLYSPSDASLIKRFIKDQLVKFVARKYRDSKSSSLQSLQRGRKTEIDFLNGYVVDMAKHQNLKTPANEIAITMIKEIENGSRKIKSENIVEIVHLLIKLN